MEPTKDAVSKEGWPALFGAWLVSLAASLGALFVGEVMGQTPCVLCWYQRSFMFPLAVVLGIAAFSADRAAWRYSFALAAGGLLMAGYHVLLFYGVIPEAVAPCGRGPSCRDAEMTIFGAVPLPVLSLFAFAAIAILVLVSRRKSLQ